MHARKCGAHTRAAPAFDCVLHMFPLKDASKLSKRCIWHAFVGHAYTLCTVEAIISFVSSTIQLSLFTR